MINLSKFIKRENIFLNIKYKTKSNILNEILNGIKFETKGINKKSLLKGISEFENFTNEELSSFIVFIPKVYKPLRDELILSLSTFPGGISYDSKIKNQIRLVVLLLSGNENIKTFFKIIIKMNFLLDNQTLQQKLIYAESIDDILELIETAESEKAFELKGNLQYIFDLQKYYFQKNILETQVFFHEGENVEIINSLIKTLNKKISNLKSELDNEIFDTFNKLHERYEGKVLVNIADNSCTGCNTVIPVSIVNDINRLNKLFQCSHCGRYLFYAEL